LRDGNDDGRGSRGRGGRVVACVALLLALGAGLWIMLREPASLEGGAGLESPAPDARASDRADLTPPAPGQAPAPTPQSPRAPLEPDDELARRLFEDACRWIARGQPPVQRVRDITLHLDGKLDVVGMRHQGPIRQWLELPDLYRQELSTASSLITVVMNRGNLHVREDAGVFAHMNRSADGARAIRQVQDGIDRLSDLATLLTLEALKGPDVAFEWQGEKIPSGTFARPGGGTWAKVVRKVQGRPDITFWLAHERDAEGKMRATYPGVVRLAGDPAQDIPTQDFLFQDWTDPPPDRPRAFRIPRKLLMFHPRADQQPVKVLSAVVTELEINTGIDPARFEVR
jgi:hypothetical protein